MSNSFCLKKMNTVTEKHKCTLCGACYNICPVGAIYYEEDSDGFEYPCIDKEKCTNCGLCTKICPALNTKHTQEIVEKLKKPISYGGYIKDEEVREKSSSGGVFSALADYVFEKGGYVCGAMFTHGGTLEHVLINKKEDITPLRGSKYVQSHVGDVYKQIKELLKNDNYVLFTGTPCQVAGLYSVLGKDYEKLITVDLLCHGCPSQKLFKEYLNEITEGHLEDITKISFRYKKNGWRRFFFKVEYNETEKEVQFSDSEYCNAFDKNLIIRKSCTDCRFNRLPRQGDFTIGDYWGIENYYKDIDDNKGTSVIITNTKKSQKLLKELKNNFKKLKKTELDTVKNHNMLQWKSYNHNHRNYFMKRYSSGDYNSITELINECLNKNDGIAIMNYGYAKDNYGSVLTAYALQKKIRSYGYTPNNIRMWDNEYCPDMSNLEDFARKYIDETPPCWSKVQLKDLNKYYQTFIVGPDAVWKDLGFLPDFNVNLFNFVNFSKNICSYAASFASDKLISFKKGCSEAVPVSDEEIYKRKSLMKRFSHISVRESSGIGLCKKYFDVEAEHVLDAVFFLNQDQWKELIAGSLNPHVDNVTYILNMDSMPDGCMEYIKTLPSLKELYKGEDYLKNFTREHGTEFKYNGEPIEEWLQSIMDAELVLIDSFHGLCFSIIFNKKFVVFPTTGSGFDRQRSLLNKLNLTDRIAHSLDDLKRLKDIPIDYTSVNSILQTEIKKSEQFLEKILYSHEHPDRVRGYMEALEIRQDIELSQNNTQTSNSKQKWYLFGIPVLKRKMHKNNPWIYILGLRLIKIIRSPKKTYYKLFGKIELLKKKVN